MFGRQISTRRLLQLCVFLFAGAAMGRPAIACAADSAPSGPVTLVWCCAGTADVYLNGKPLRDAKPDFTSRADETGWEYTAKTELKVDDVLTVGARRGAKGSGFRLAAFDEQGRLVWQTETSNWRAYEIKDPRSAKRWYLPATAARAKMAAAGVPSKDFPPMEQFEKPRTDVADPIWSQTADVVLLYAKITARRNMARLPFLEMARAGKVKYFANGVQLDGLQPNDLDGSNRIKRYKQPLRYTLEFDPPVEVHGTVVTLAEQKGAVTWQIECANSRDELAKKTGSYREVTKPQTTRGDQAVDQSWKPIKAACWQLSARKDGGDASLLLRKFELFAPVNE